MARDWDARTYDRVADPMTRWGLGTLERLPLTGDERVVDAGCGTGRVTEQLAERLPNGRVIALRKSDGAYIEQYRLLDRATDWEDIRGWYVEPGVDDQPDALVWLTANGLRRALLEAAVIEPGESTEPSPAGSSDASPAASAP